MLSKRCRILLFAHIFICEEKVETTDFRYARDNSGNIKEKKKRVIEVSDA
jgi:hypothetical protein